MRRLQFVTAIPLDVRKGSGCFVGIQTLARGIEALGGEVHFITPKVHLPVYVAERFLFNRMLRAAKFVPGDITVGFDADGYTIAGRRGGPHIACIKGVVADLLPYERGATRASLRLQSQMECRHARGADLVIAPSHYCADKVEELYNAGGALVVPELIDLDRWADLLRNNPAPPFSRERFTVLSVCRFYPRKRVHVLLAAAARLKTRIPDFEVRIVGGGPESARLRRLWRDLRLEDTVHWVGDATEEELAAEYNRADVFCHPSVQEGFGIVFLEAMAARKPIVAVRTSAVPEVVRHGLLVEPDSPEALSKALEELYADSSLRSSLAGAGRRHVECYEMKRVAQCFLDACARLG